MSDAPRNQSESVPVWEIERDRHGLMFSGPLEVGECRRVVPEGDYVCRKQEILALLDALDRLTTDEKSDPCWRDHHGYCQAHSLEEDCSMQHARELLAALRPEVQDVA